MNKKQFIIGVSIVSAVAVAILGFALWPNDTSDSKSPTEKYSVTESDKNQISEVANLLVGEAGNFGIPVQPLGDQVKESDDAFKVVFDLRDGSTKDVLNSVKPRGEAGNQALAAFDRSSAVYPSKVWAGRADSNFLANQLLSFRASVNAIKYPKSGDYRSFESTDEDGATLVEWLPEVEIKLSAETSLTSRTMDYFRTDFSEGDEDKRTLKITELTKSGVQDIHMTLVKFGDGWKIVDLSDASSYPFLAMDPSLSGESVKLALENASENVVKVRMSDHTIEESK